VSVVRLAFLNFWLRHLSRRYLAREQNVARARASWERAARLSPRPKGMRAERRPLVHAGRRVDALRLAGPATGPAPAVFWIHGGAYCLGSPATHAAMVAQLAARLGGGAVLPDYRLAPEHAFPAAVEDILTAYRGLLDEDLPAERVVVGGDSAGGGLAFALLHMIGEAGLPTPRAVVAFSPWVDLTGSGESLRTLADCDVMLPIERMAEIRDHYLAGADARDPRASPLFGHFTGGPPVLLLSSQHEALRDDVRMMAARLHADGVAVTHEEWESLPHAWPLFAGFLPQADRALDRAAAWLQAAEAASAGRG
jgi:epsilon-lactone hydrolase